MITRKSASMTVEFFNIFAMLIGGCLLISISGIRGWGIPAVGFIVGLAFFVIIGSVQVLTNQNTSPLVTLFLTILIPMALWAWHYYQNRFAAFPFSISPTILFLITTAIAIFILNSVNLLNLAPDSYRYAQIGSLLESGVIHFAQPDLLLTRLLAVPLMHAPANFENAFFMRSINPILALSTVACLAWFSQKGLLVSQSNFWTIAALPGAAALLLITNQFFIYNAFYVNGHVLYAALLLLVAGSSWLYALDANVPKSALRLIIFFAVPALIVTRPEASLHLFIILLPIFVSIRFSPRHKALILAVLSLSIIIWNGFLFLKFLSADQSAPMAVSGMLCIGIASIAAIPLFFFPLFDKISPRILPSAEIGLWLGLLIAAIINPEMFFGSTIATINNTIMGTGLWGYSLIILGIFFIGILVLSNAPERIFLRFPVTTFLPFGLLLAFLREVPYRIGAFDSFNRMFLHIVPLAILFIVSSAMTARWGLNFKQKPSEHH